MATNKRWFRPRHLDRNRTTESSTTKNNQATMGLRFLMTFCLALLGHGLLPVLIPLAGIATAAPQPKTQTSSMATTFDQLAGVCNVPSHHATIQAAVSDPACTVINVAPGVYVENVTINRSVTIQGADAATTIVDGGARGSVFVLLTDRLPVTLARLTVRNGLASNGGGIANNGSTLMLDKMLIINNRAEGSGGSSGGGIYNSGPGTVTLNDSTVADNVAEFSGGAIYTSDNFDNGLPGICTRLPGTIKLVNSSVRNNHAFLGGGILYQARLILTASVVRDNTAAWKGGGFYGIWRCAVLENSTIQSNNATEEGGGMFNDHGVLQMNGGAFQENSAGQIGGGLLNENRGGSVSEDQGKVTINNSAILSNRSGEGISGGGAGIYSIGPWEIVVRDSKVSENRAGSFREGGGIYNGAESRLTLMASVVRGNEAFRGGGIHNDGILTINNSTIEGNRAEVGGGLRNDNQATLTNSTVNNNVADMELREGDDDESGSGGGIFNQFGATLTATNSTLSANMADRRGGGLANSEAIGPETTAVLTYVTVNGNSANSGGGLFNSGILKLTGTIIANSPSGNDCAGELISSGGYNLDSDNTCNLTAAGDLPATNPRLEPLADNGGATQTHALQASSPALNASAPACPPPATDQRGVARPQGRRCDIGAYEQAVSSGTVIFLSFTSGNRVAGVSFKDEDIVALDLATNTLSLYFDGSDVGLSALDLDAFELLADGSILMSFNIPQLIPSLGLVEPADIIKFIPTSLGSATAGSFVWFLDGSDVGLDGAAEGVDAVALAADGRLIVSTRDGFSVPELMGNDEDLIILNDAVFGDSSVGRWALYFDGSDVGLEAGSEDVKASWSNPTNRDLYLVTSGPFSLAGVSGDSDDIFICTLSSLGETSSCTFAPFWDGAAFGFGGQHIDGLEIGDSSRLAAMAARRGHRIEVIEAEAATDAEQLEADEDGEGEDGLNYQLFLPLMQG